MKKVTQMNKIKNSRERNTFNIAKEESKEQYERLSNEIKTNLVKCIRIITKNNLKQR